MRQVFVRQLGGDRLLLIFGGWGMDERLIDLPSAVGEGVDVMLCYDYRSMNFDASPLAGYRSLHLLAWSMGVWVAGRVLGGMTLPWAGRVAFNGTPFPMDDVRGIPVSVFEGTLRGFSETVLAKFRRRMCGSGDALRLFMERAPQRTVEELHGELQALHDAVLVADGSHTLQWDLAVVGLRDRIFPPANQLAAWQDVAEVRTVDAAHYDAAVMKHLIETDLTWTRN